MGNRDRGSLGTARIAVFFGLTLLAISSVCPLHARRITWTLPSVDRGDAAEVLITPPKMGPESLRSRRDFDLAPAYHYWRAEDLSYRSATAWRVAQPGSSAGAVARSSNTPAQVASPASPQVPAEKLAFEVVSIKVNHSGVPQFGLGLPPGRMTATNVSVKRLIEFAYQSNRNSLQLRDDQISGGPAWINSDRFDIDAKVEDSMIEKEKTLPFSEWANQVRLMLQSLLADRFQLKAHFETREMPEYALVVAKGGLKLTVSTVAPLGPVVSGPPPPGGPRLRQVPGQITGTGMAIGNLVDALAQQPDLVGRAVVDQTGLGDRYDFTLHWTPEVQGGPNGPIPENAPQPDTSGVSIFTALQEQLGLKLETTKGPVQLVVIDHVEEPSPN